MFLRWMPYSLASIGEANATALFIDTFSSGNTTSPRASDIGELLITDGSGIMSVSGGNLVVNGTQANPSTLAVTDDGATNKEFTRSDGLCMFAELTATTTAGANYISFKASDSGTLDYTIGITTTTSYTVFSRAQNVVAISHSAGQLAIMIITRAIGAYLITKHPTESNYKLRWVSDELSGTVESEIRFGGTTTTYNISYPVMKVAQLPYPFANSDTDFRIFNVSGAVSAGTTRNTSDGDFIMRVTVTTLTTTTGMQIHFRIQDSSNYWMMNVTSSGVAQLIRVVSGSPDAAVMTLSGVVATDVLTIIADGSDITFVKKSGASYTSATYASASSYKTYSDTKLNALGDGAMSDWSCYPRVITGAAASALAQVEGG